MPRVAVVTPDGTTGTVEESELGMMPPGTKVTSGATASSGADDGGLLGTLAAGALGAGSTATLGATDKLLSEGAYVLGGDSGRRELQRNLRGVREANPKAEFAGEFAGLLANPEAVSTFGEAAGAEVAARAGKGLLGHVAEDAARNAVESVVLGQQHRVTEESLGNPQQNAEAIFSSSTKDALLGAGLGAALGAGSFGLGRARGLVGEATGLLGKPGPIGARSLDELAGAEGAGRDLYAQAKSAESAIDGIRKTGATSDQAAQAVDELGTMGKASAEAGIGKGVVNSMADAYADMHGGSRGDMLRQHYSDVASHAIESEAAVDARARKLADVGTKAMRGLEDTSNQVHFTERPDQFAKLLDPAKYNAARDAVASMGQDVRALVGELDMLPTKGGIDLGVSRLGKQLKEFDAVVNHLPESGGPQTMSEMYMAAYRLKQAVGKYSGFGKPPHLRTPGENALTELYDTLRVGLEDENAFGQAGAANKDWNAAFSDNFGRRRDYGNRFAVSIDEASGVPVPELDAGKMKSFLNQLGGAEADQSVKSIEATIDWMRNRANKIEQYADLTPAQKGALASGRTALDSFEKELRVAMKYSEAANRIREATNAEKGHGIGGLLGLVGDAVTKPATTMSRLATLGRTVQHVEDGIRSSFRRFLKGEGAEVGSAATHTAPRQRETVIKELEGIRELSSNPAALEQAAMRLVGDTDRYAPQIANQLKLTAMRTLLYLAREAPRGSSTQNGVLGKPVPRYSDIQVHDWEAKRNAAFDVRTLPADLKRGTLNRDAIQAAEFAQPELFAKMQSIALDELETMAAKGQLEKMPQSQKAAIASLLKIAPDETWTPQFIAVMQNSKTTPAPADQKPGTPGQLARKSNQKPMADLYNTESARIEAGGHI